MANKEVVMAEGKKPVLKSDPDPVEEVLREIEKQTDRFGRAMGRGLIRLGNILTGRALTAEDAEKLIGEMRRRERFFDEGKARDEPYFITALRWTTEQYDRRQKEKAAALPSQPKE